MATSSNTLRASMRGTPQANDTNKTRVPTMLSVPEMRSPQKFKVLVAANGSRDIAQAEALSIRFSKHPKIETKAIVDTITNRLNRTAVVWENKRLELLDRNNPLDGEQAEIERYQKLAYEMCEWADILVLAPIDANTLAMMLCGMTGNIILEVLRSWDVSKKIIMIPGMTSAMWDNPMTRKQLHEVRTKWNWVRVMNPILWHFDSSGPEKCFVGWTGFNELIEVMENQADLMSIGHDVDETTSGELARRSLKTDTHLPPEIWSLIFEYVGDWEVAVKMRVWTNLPTPDEWKTRPPHDGKDLLAQYMRELEWTMLLQSNAEVIDKLSHAPCNILYLSSLCVKLVIKFGMTDILTYLERNFKDILWASFGSKLLPTKASAVYGRPEILEWWRTSPSFLKKDYTAEAIDGASQSGFVHVLDWWHKSSLPLKYTEAALEQASSKGHILALEWWKEASSHQGSYFIDSEATKGKHSHASPAICEGAPMNDSAHTSVGSAPLRLKVGRSILAAAQNGRANTVRWWDTSGIPYSHSELVAKVASAHGCVNVLEAWKELKGDKFAMGFDNQVLVGPTKNGSVEVLEWWKRQTLEVDDAGAPKSMGGGGAGVGTNSRGRLRVEYKTCDIEEALEDCVGSAEAEDLVRKWWARNGLNLGVNTSEWLSTKTL
ncbi:MAG: hypothetical protein M1818_006041 [Claussenomyces sp. TS43310]|nr:MAG: hypothetical protein M1818_006041 [Claussenomyces sp. TS43310]